MLAQRWLQFRVIGAEPVILINLHIRQDSEPGQVPGSDFDLDQPGWRSAIQPVTDEKRQRFDLVDGLLERIGQDFGGEGREVPEEFWHEVSPHLSQ